MVNCHIKRAVYVGLNMTLFEYDWMIGQLMQGNAAVIQDEVVRGMWQELLGTEMYKNYMKLIIEPFLIEANKHGIQAQKKVYVNIPWFGASTVNELAQSFIKACEDIFSDRSLSQIAVVNFSGLPQAERYVIAGQEKYCDQYFDEIKPIDLQNPCTGNKDIKFSCGSLYEKIFLSDYQKDCIFVISYPLSSRAKPGNDYWATDCCFKSSAAEAASHSTLLQMHMTDINPCIKKKIMDDKKFIECEEKYNKQQKEKQKDEAKKIKKQKNIKNYNEKTMPGQKTNIKENKENIDSKKLLWARIITCLKVVSIPIGIVLIYYLYNMYGFSFFC